LLAGRIRHHHLDRVRPPSFLPREEDPCRERQTRQREGDRGDLKVIEDADQRRPAVVPENHLVTERDVLDVHRGLGAKESTLPPLEHGQNAAPPAPRSRSREESIVLRCEQAPSAPTLVKARHVVSRVMATCARRCAAGPEPSMPNLFLTTASPAKRKARYPISPAHSSGAACASSYRRGIGKQYRASATQYSA